MHTLLELAERCERATGPAPTIDCEISRYVFDHDDCETVGAGWKKAPAYTASLDAALALVPEGWGFYLEKDAAAVWREPIPYRARPVNRGKAATPALALCAAALRARAAQEVSA